jgi:hypothetical protein
MASAATTSDSGWGIGAKVGRPWGLNGKQVAQLAADGLIAVRRIPGCHPIYSADEVARLVMAHTKEAGRTLGGAS